MQNYQVTQNTGNTEEQKEIFPVLNSGCNFFLNQREGDIAQDCDV